MVRALLLGGTLLVRAVALPAHPLHTTMAELERDRARGTVRVTIRVFVDDLGRAVLRLPASAAPPAPLGDPAAAAYATSHFTLEVDGQALPLTSCGVRRTGDLAWICLESARGGRTEGVRVRNSMLFELYADQINIVQSHGAERASVLFTRGDGPKRIA